MKWMELCPEIHIIFTNTMVYRLFLYYGRQEEQEEMLGADVELNGTHMRLFDRTASL